MLCSGVRKIVLAIVELAFDECCAFLEIAVGEFARSRCCVIQVQFAARVVPRINRVMPITANAFPLTNA